MFCYLLRDRITNRVDATVTLYQANTYVDSGGGLVCFVYMCQEKERQVAGISTALS